MPRSLTVVPYGHEASATVLHGRLLPSSVFSDELVGKYVGFMLTARSQFSADASN